MADRNKTADRGRHAGASLSAERSPATSRRSLLRESSPFLVKEAYKALRTNIAYSLVGREAKCIAVSSADRGDGKSTNSLNIAISFAQIGKKVALVDCDLRLPTVAEKLNIIGKPGLSDYLVGEAELKEVIRKDVQGVDVIPAGNIPADPTPLLESTQIEELLEAMREYYEYIILDLPPVNMVADAAILSRCIDGLVLVVRHGATRQKDISRMLNNLSKAGAKVLGFIYNGVSIGGKKYYKRKYYSSYGYYAK